MTWRPAVIVDDLPQPLSGDSATAALAAWNQARSCTNVAVTPGAPVRFRANREVPASAATADALGRLGLSVQVR